MDEQFKLIDFTNDDVISFGDNTYKFNKVKAAIDSLSKDGNFGNNFHNYVSRNDLKIDPKIVDPNNNYENYAKWFEEGIDCEILQLGDREWRKGKIRVKFSVEVLVEDSEETPEPNEPESPLDDIRRMIQEDDRT